MPEPYPEHVRLRAIADKSQCIWDFIEWLEEQKIDLADEDGNGIRESREKLIARFFNIDLRKIDDEKRAMLDEMRKINEVEEKK